MACPVCGGTGKRGLLGGSGFGLLNHQCKACHGTGAVPLAFGDESAEENAAEGGSFSHRAIEVVEESYHAIESGIGAISKSFAGDTRSLSRQSPANSGRGNDSARKRGLQETVEDFGKEATAALESARENASATATAAKIAFSEVESALKDGFNPEEEKGMIGKAKDWYTGRNKYELLSMEDCRNSDEDRGIEYMKQFDDRNLEVSKCHRHFANCLAFSARPLVAFNLGFMWVFSRIYAVCSLLHMVILQMAFGLALCFFGGEYTASVACVEAARHFGGKQLVEHLSEIHKDARKAGLANASDDYWHGRQEAKMSCCDQIMHKARVLMTPVKDPDRLMAAMSMFFCLCIAVVATVHYTFAKVLVLGLAIAEMITFTFVRLLAPIFASAMGNDLHLWVHPVIGVAMKTACVIAGLVVLICFDHGRDIWSTIYTSLRGAHLFALGVFHVLHKKQLLRRFPDWLVKKPVNPNQTYVDEYIWYPIAAAGIYLQIKLNFRLPFPYNIALLPVTIVEWLIRLVT